ncbi:hypothetical protein LLH23_09530 [bacterium]|nr:hypothetical protein [bacterium]
MRCALLVCLLLVVWLDAGLCAPARAFTGRFFSGQGDTAYLQLLDTSYQMLYPSPDLQNLGMLYNPSWSGFVEGPTWGAWWIQNSYGPSYCGLPFFVEPYATFLANSQDLWFSQMGDGKRVGGGKWQWVAPDGCLCDAAAPGWIYYKQGDGRVDTHDWGMEFTAAGLLLQAEQLLISRDPQALAHYLPLLERCANFLESRRDPANSCFLAGPAGNLLAPSYAGYKKPDGTYDRAYLTGLSVTTIAALDRLIELEKLAGRADQAALYAGRRDAARQGLRHLTTDEGYFIKYLDSDGTKHGVYGADKHGYFEAICNHDAIAFRAVDDAQARRIYDKIASIPGLRPHDVIITNCPGLDDLYVEPKGLWEFGRWVNGGHWTTCEARMVLAYYRLGRFEDARRSLQHLLGFARQFRFDNNLTDFGNAVYQPKEPINCVYDSWGGPLAMLRGLFEYLYQSDRLVLAPHIPPGITALDQQFPVRFGAKRLYLSTRGAGPVTGVYVNRQPWKTFDRTTVTLPYERLPQRAQVTICLGGAKPQFAALPAEQPLAVPPADDELWDVGRWWQNPLGNSRPLRLGADSTGGCLFVGDMRRVRLWQRALSEQEIAALAADVRAEAADGLVVDFLFDRATGDACPNPPNPDLLAKPVGEVAIVDSEGGKVARFAGKGFLEVPCDPRLTLTTAYTLEAWIKPEVLPDSGARLIDRVTAGVDDGYLLDTCPKSSLRLITERGHAGYGANLPPGQWAHVAATFDAQAGLRIVLNGKLVASAPCSGSPRGAQYAQAGAFLTRMRAAQLGETAEAKQAELVVAHLQALRERLRLERAGKLPPLPPASQVAADRSYIQAADRLTEGLRRVLKGYEQAENPQQKRMWELWQEATAGP